MLDAIQRAGSTVRHPTLIVVALSMLAATARAEPRSESESGYASPLSKPGVFVDGGVVGFIDSRLRDLVHDGQSWGARVAMGPFENVRLEVTYLASIQQLDPRAGDSLIGHGAQGMLRINVAPWLAALEPFFYFGGGWTRYHVRGRAPGSPLEAQDNVLSLPFGLGIARHIGAFVIDIRGGLETASGCNLLPIEREPSSSTDAASMERFTVVAVAGVTI